MILQELRKQLTREKKQLGFGDKKKIADTLEITYFQVIDVFRNQGSEELTKKVLDEVCKLNVKRMRAIQRIKQNSKKTQRKRSN